MAKKPQKKNDDWKSPVTIVDEINDTINQKIKRLSISDAQMVVSSVEEHCRSLYNSMEDDAEENE